MLFKEAVTKRILNLCNDYDYTINKLAEMSCVPPSTLRAMVANQVENPSSYVIFKICRTLKITIKDFFDSDLFDINNIDD